MENKEQKILIVSDAWAPQVNGVVRTLSYTKKCLESFGYQVFVITPDQFFSIPCPTYPEIRLALFPGNKMTSSIKSIAPDIIHISTEGPLGISARNYAIRHDLRFSTAYHTRFPEYIHSRFRIPLGFTYRFIRWFHKHSSAVMVPTSSVLNDLQKWEVKNAVLWPRGVDTELFKPNAERAKNDQPIFLYVGRIAIEKNLEAFLSLDLKGEKWVVGDGPELKKLRQKYPNVTFFGAKTKEQLPFYYNKADVFVFPSRTDTFGLVLLEAMACGLPVAAFPVTGPIDVIEGDANNVKAKAGILDGDLGLACQQALTLSRKHVRKHAENFSWDHATKIFKGHLVKSRETGSYNFIDNPYKDNKGIRRFIKATKNSLAGLLCGLKEESAFRQEILLTCLLVPLALLLETSLLEKLLMISSVILVLIVELLNSSIEAAVDRISLENHGLSKRAKDYGSAAVFLSLMLCGTIYLVFIFRSIF